MEARLTAARGALRLAWLIAFAVTALIVWPAFMMTAFRFSGGNLIELVANFAPYPAALAVALSLAGLAIAHWVLGRFEAAFVRAPLLSAHLAGVALWAILTIGHGALAFQGRAWLPLGSSFLVSGIGCLLWVESFLFLLRRKGLG